MPGSSNQPNNNGMDELFDDEATKKDSQIEELQELLQKEIDERQEERFFFIICLVILFDIVVFSAMDNATGPIIIFIFEAIILAPLARRFGLAKTAAIFHNVTNRLADSLKKTDD